MAAVLLILEWHLLDTHLWCDRCLVSSRIRWALVQPWNLHTLATVTICHQCGTQERHR